MLLFLISQIIEQDFRPKARKEKPENRLTESWNRSIQKKATIFVRGNVLHRKRPVPPEVERIETVRSRRGRKECRRSYKRRRGSIQGGYVSGECRAQRPEVGSRLVRTRCTVSRATTQLDCTCPNLLKPSPYLELYIERERERELILKYHAPSFLHSSPFISSFFPSLHLLHPSFFVFFFFIRSACERTRAADTRRTRGAYNATETRYSLQEGLIGRENYER